MPDTASASLDQVKLHVPEFGRRQALAHTKYLDTDDLVTFIEVEYDTRANLLRLYYRRFVKAYVERIGLLVKTYSPAVVAPAVNRIGASLVLPWRGPLQ